MKRKLLILFLSLLMLLPAFSLAESAGDEALSGSALSVYEAVKYCTALPKDAQVLSAAEYYCKVEGYPLRLLLIEATQTPIIEEFMGKSARLLVLDTDTGESVNCLNVVWSESPDIADRQDALNRLYSGFLSYAEGVNEWVYADHEMLFPLSDAQIAGVNAALTSHFAR